MSRRIINVLVAALAAATVSAAGPLAAQQRVVVGSPEELLTLFEKHDYTPESWQSGVREIPRLYIMQIGPNWKVNSGNMEVINKKRIFFRVLAPLVLHANELLLEDRARLLAMVEAGPASDADRQWLADLAAAYKIDDTSTPAALAELAGRVDAVPVSLVLAQGAEESGWGTSRFAAEGNALFGQWTWGGEGIKPKAQRKGLGDYAIAAFDTPLGSIQAYMRNINTHASYEALRERRAAIRAAGKPLSGWDLAETLTGYSERGADYVKSLHAIMRVNKLQATDEATLTDAERVEIYPAGQ